MAAVRLKEKPQPPWVYDQTQTDLLKTKRTTQTLSCRKLHNLKVPLGPEGTRRHHGCKCAQIDNLPFMQVTMLCEELIRQHTIQESKQETDAWDYALTQAERQWFFKTLETEGTLASNPEIGLIDLQGKGGWTCISAWSKLKSLPPATKKYDTMRLGEENSIISSQAQEKDSAIKLVQSYENECIKHGNYWRILTEMHGSSHLPFNLSSKIHCLSGPHSSLQRVYQDWYNQRIINHSYSFMQG